MANRDQRGRVQAYDLDTRLRQGKYTYMKFGGVYLPLLRNASSLTALPTALQGQVATIVGAQGFNPVPIEYFQTTAQTLQPVPTTNGLVLDGDQVDNESQEYVVGGNSARNPLAMVIGGASGDPDFFFRARLEITVPNGSDQLVVGWRKVQTYAVPTSFLNGGDAIYTDFAALGFNATVATPNPVGSVTSVGHAVNIATPLSFTWAAGKVHDLEVQVRGGKALYFINGVRSGNPVKLDALGAAITSQSTVTGVSYTFTAGLTLVPFIFVRQDAALTTAVILHELEAGHLVNIGRDPSQE